MELPNDFYTVSTLLTLPGSSMAIWIITSVLGDLLPSLKRTAKKWISLILAFGLALLSATQIPEKSLLVLVVAFVNGFLIYLTSVGINTITNKVPRSSVRETSKGTSKFFENWW